MDQEQLETELDQDLTEMGRTLQIRSGGTRLKVFEDPDHPGQASFEILSSSERMQKTSMLAQLVDFLYDLQAAVIDHIVEPRLPILTELSWTSFASFLMMRVSQTKPAQDDRDPQTLSIEYPRFGFVTYGPFR